jgi:hypothetical protein
MTVRVTVHNNIPDPGPMTVVGVRELTQVAGEVVMGQMHFLGPNASQQFFLNDYQFLTVVELKNGRPGGAPPPLAPTPTEPVLDVLM